jgi:uncharacterized membrane protein YkoI
VIWKRNKSEKQENTMRKFMGMTLTAVALTLCAPLAIAQSGSVSVAGQKEKDYHKLATVSMQEAIQAALAKVPGKAVEADLDDENGILVYEIKIMGDDNQKHEVIVDAGNQNIINTKVKKSFF